MHSLVFHISLWKHAALGEIQDSATDFSQCRIQTGLFVWHLGQRRHGIRPHFLETEKQYEHERRSLKVCTKACDSLRYL